jgi:D-alanyl-D-alanine carboxypeptidase
MNFAELVELPEKSQYNVGLPSANNARMIELLGNPRDNYTGECQEITNKTLRKKISTQKFGKVKLTGLTVAIESLRSIFGRVSVEIPQLIPHLGTAGMLCCRRVKLPGGVLGKNISNHSWGTAVDVTVDGKLDIQGDGLAQRGLLILSTYFNAAGWVWGASFPREDAMHFEVSAQLLTKWSRDGLI